MHLPMPCVCVTRCIYNGVRKRRTGMLPAQDRVPVTALRCLAALSARRRSRGQTLPRTHTGLTHRGRVAPPQQPRAGLGGHIAATWVVHHRLFESRRETCGGKERGPQRFHRGVATRSEPAPRRPPQHPHPIPASARYRSRKPGRRFLPTPHAHPSVAQGPGRPRSHRARALASNGNSRSRRRLGSRNRRRSSPRPPW
eukprot:2383254-Prymnesium_polylepis.1